MAELLDIIIHPNDAILRKRSAEISADELMSRDLASLCADMALTMEKKDGVGLAAPQIGRNLRLIVIAAKDGPLCLANPVLRDKSFFKEWGQEGCLSVPGKTGEVRRHRRLVCDYVDLDGRPRSLPAKGLLARVLQHEIDHLDGVLFIDKAKNIRDAG